MKNNKKEVDEHPHFVNETCPISSPWLTNIYFGQRDGLGSHAHLVASGAMIVYLRDQQGKEIIKNGEVVNGVREDKNGRKKRVI